MAEGLGIEANVEPRVKQTDTAEEKKSSSSSVRSARKNVEGRVMGSRRIFAPNFKLKVLDSYRQDSDCRGNQRATARKYGIHRRQIQKWLQVEASLRTSVEVCPVPASPERVALNLCADAAAAAEAGSGRQRDDKARLAGGEEAVAAAEPGESHEQQQAACQRGGGPALPVVVVVVPTDKPTALSNALDSADYVRAEEETNQMQMVSPTPSFPSVPIDVPISDDNDDNDEKTEVTVSLFPTVKIEQLHIKKEPLNNFSPQSSKDYAFEMHPSPPISRYDTPIGDDDLTVDELDSDDEEINIVDGCEQALDFTCAALSKRRSFSLQFKLEVLDAFHAGRHCRGNQRATARQFGINRRQVQKWLHQEDELRGETVSRVGMQRHRLGRWSETDDVRPAEESPETVCALDPSRQSPHDGWDLSNRKRKSIPLNVIPFKKRTVEFLLKQENEDYIRHIENETARDERVLPVAQETALCLIKAKCPPREERRDAIESRSDCSNDEVSSSADVTRVVGQALYHSSRERAMPRCFPLPPTSHLPLCFPPGLGFPGLHHMLSLYQGYVGDKAPVYPHDLKLQAVENFHGEVAWRSSHFSAASRLSAEHDRLQRWIKHEDQLRQYHDSSQILNVFSV